MAVAVDFLYRDGCNYKAPTVETFAGELTDELVARLRAASDAGEWIVPEQVGLTHPARENPLFSARFPDEEDDHGYVEVLFDQICTVDVPSPSDQRTFLQFIEACEKATEDGWDPDLAIEAAGGWTDPDVAAQLRGASDE